MNNLEQFNPKLAELQALAEKAKAIDVTDLSLVKKTRLELRDARTSITKTGKEIRDEALKYQKAVIAKEKELVSVVSVEEDRLKKVEDEAVLLELVEKNKQVITWRIEELAKVSLTQFDEQELLEMNDKEFDSLLEKEKQQVVENEFLATNGYTEETKNDFHLIKDKKSYKLYKLVAVMEV